MARAIDMARAIEIGWMFSAAELCIIHINTSCSRVFISQCLFVSYIASIYHKLMQGAGVCHLTFSGQCQVVRYLVILVLPAGGGNC